MIKPTIFGEKIWTNKKNVVILQVHYSRNHTDYLLILGYGVMVTLQILVLSFLVRVRVSQQYASK